MSNEYFKTSYEGIWFYTDTAYDLLTAIRGSMGADDLANKHEHNCHMMDAVLVLLDNAAKSVYPDKTNKEFCESIQNLLISAQELSENVFEIDYCGEDETLYEIYRNNLDKMDNFICYVKNARDFAIKKENIL